LLSHEFDDSLPIVLSLAHFESIVKLVNFDILRVISAQNFSDDETIAKVSSHISDAVGQVKSIKPLDQFSRDCAHFLDFKEFLL
jgi:hypothetical protein